MIAALRRAVPLLLLALVLAPEGAAQRSRYVLGRRLAAMEEAFAGADAAAKARALPELEESVKSFFALRFGEAARRLDRARFALRGEEPDEVAAWALAWSPDPARRFLATAPRGELRVVVRKVYEPQVAPPEDAEVDLVLVGADGTTLARVGPLPFAPEGPDGEVVVALPLVGVPAGDHRVLAVLSSGPGLPCVHDCGVSFARHADARVAALARALDAAEGPPTLERATAARHLDALEELLAGEVPETDLPAARLLAEAEALVGAADGERLLDARRPGSHRLRVPVAGRAVDVRLHAPPLPGAGAPRPCVVALHGAGGSDEMFFQGYGAGEAVRLAERRGWVLVAPRAPLLGIAPVAELVDALADRYRIDRDRVAVLGHSMGAMQALRVARDAPERFAALAAIGGGRPSRRDARLAGLPIYVAAGSEDFGLRGARATAESLEEHGASVRLDVREGIEHLTIVQEVLPTAFAFFDAALRD